MRTARALITRINQESNRSLSINEAKILHWVFVSGMLSFRTIREVILPDVGKGSAHRTARRLVKRGLLTPLAVPGISLPGWGLSRNLQTLFAEEIGFSGCAPYRFVSSIENHNSRVRWLARRIDETRETEWIAHEPMLRANEMSMNPRTYSDVNLSVPDLISTFNENGKITKIAWEMELTAKSGGRIERILENRVSSDQWDKVIYILGAMVNAGTCLQKNRRVVLTSPRIGPTKKPKPILFVPFTEAKNLGFGAKGVSLDGESTIAQFLG